MVCLYLKMNKYGKLELILKHTCSVQCLSEMNYSTTKEFQSCKLSSVGCTAYTHVHVRFLFNMYSTDVMTKVN